MFCTSCGKQLPEGAANCPDCGAAVTEAANAQPVAAEPVVAEPVVEPVAAEPVVAEPVVAENAVDPGKTLGLVSLILGIAGLALGTICSCLFACLGGSIPFIASIVGLVLGILATNKSKAAGFENKQAKIGMILSIVAMVVVIVFIIINAIIGGVVYANGFSY